MTTRKSILFCGNGMSAEAIKPIKEMGYTVYLITDFMKDTGVEDADIAVPAKTKDPVDALRAARELAAKGCKFDGVLSLCWDCAPSVSTIAEEFKLKAVPKAVAEAATNKSIRSRIFAEHDVSAPKFEIVTTLDAAKRAAEQIGFPIVLKPTNLSSTKGVILVDTADQLEQAYRHTTSFIEKSEVLVNEFVQGTEHSTEGLMIDGHLHLTGLSDRIFKYSEYKPFFIEVGDVMPTVLSEATCKEMFRVTELAALALGIRDGVVKGDMLCSSSGRVVILELAARLGGPRFGTEMIPLSNGTAILKAAVQQAVGDPIDLRHLETKFERGMVNRTIFPKAGTVTEIRGLREARALPGYYDFKWWTPDPLKIGDLVEEPTYGCGNAGYIIAVGATREEALKNADAIENTIQIVTRQ